MRQHDPPPHSIDASRTTPVSAPTRDHIVMPDRPAHRARLTLTLLASRSPCSAHPLFCSAHAHLARLTLTLLGSPSFCSAHPHRARLTLFFARLTLFLLGADSQSAPVSKTRPCRRRAAKPLQTIVFQKKTAPKQHRRLTAWAQHPTNPYKTPSHWVPRPTTPSPKPTSPHPPRRPRNNNIALQKQYLCPPGHPSDHGSEESMEKENPPAPQPLCSPAPPPLSPLPRPPSSCSAHPHLARRGFAIRARGTSRAPSATAPPTAASTPPAPPAPPR
jgi:hypothetical protein